MKPQRFSNQKRVTFPHQQLNQQPSPRFPSYGLAVQHPGSIGGSVDSGRGTLGAGISPQSMVQNSNSKQNLQHHQPTAAAQTEVLDDFDFDWGDDDDDFDMVMATQAVEAATCGNPQSYGVSPSRRDMTLENIRLELAFKESNGEDVRSEDFMQDGVLGGDISNRKDPSKLGLSEKIVELERINQELKNENYSCKGEVTNLRRLLNKNSQDRQRELVSRQTRDEESRKKEAETRQKEKKEFESLQTNFRFTEKELRAKTEHCEALKKQLQRLQLQASQLTSGQSGSPVKGASLNQSLNSSRLLHTKSLSSMGFPSANSFSVRIIQPVSTPAPHVLLPPSPEKQVTHAEVQTEASTLELEIAELEKECRKAYELQQQLISDCIEQVSASTTRELRRMLPRIKEMAAGAENKLVKGLNLQGYRYEMFFPDNLKVAEFIMDEIARKSRSDQRVLSRPVKSGARLPSQLKDWDETVGFDEGLQALLFAQKDIWGALCFVLDDLHRRIEFMRTLGNRNSLYRVNNCVHFFKLLVWGANLWSNFFPMLWASLKDKDPRKEFLEEIRKWSACILWVGNRNFEVEDVQIELRKLVLKSLTQVALKGLMHYTVANYLRLFNVISNTLSTPAHSSLYNLVECLEVAKALNRKKFLAYVCRKRNDGTCLAQQFALSTIKFYEVEKTLEKRFQLYRAYVDFLLSVSEWCVVHSNGECEDVVQVDDPDFFITSPVFNPPKPPSLQASNHSSKDDQEPVQQDLDTSSVPQGNMFDATINSMYLSEDISVINLDSDEEEQRLQKEPQFKKPKLHDSSRQERPGTSKQLLLEQSSMEVDGDNEGSTKSSYEDEWDATQQEVLEMNASQSEFSLSPNRGQEPCKKFLDCSLWEEERGKDTFRLCQCRLHLLETFMCITEDIVQMWRHLKILHECQNNTARLTEAESREAELEERIRELEEIKAKKLARSGKPKSREEYEEEMSIDRETPFWRRITNDSRPKNEQLDPEDVAHYLKYAVEIMYDSFNSAQNSISRAFGKEGANAFHVSSAYLLRYGHDLGFSPELKSYLRQLTIVQAQVSLNTDADSNFDEDFLEETALSGRSMFEDRFEVKPIPKFDPENPDIIAALPPSLVETLTELNVKKEEARRVRNAAVKSTPEDDDTDYEENDDSAQIQRKFKKIEIGTSSSSETDSEPELEAADNSEDNYATTDNSYDGEECPSKKDEECDEEDNPCPKEPKKYRKVQDYHKFCAPTFDDPHAYYNSDEEFEEVKISFNDLQEAFSDDKFSKEEDSNEKGLFVGYKTAKQVCAELDASVGDDPYFGKPLEKPDGGRINLEGQELDNFMKDLSAGLSIPGYYENKTVIWDDYTKKGVPFKI